jgi:hypothetical protein
VTRMEFFTLDICPKKGIESLFIKSRAIFFLPDMAPFVALTFRAYKLCLLLSSRQFHGDQKIDVTIFTMIHIYYGISSPFHIKYTTISSKKTFLW